MNWIIIVGATFVLGFLAGKIAAARRMTRWLRSLPEADRARVQELLRNPSPTSLPEAPPEAIARP